MNPEGLLETETSALVDALRQLDGRAPDAYEVLETRLDYFKRVTQRIEAQLSDAPERLVQLQERFRHSTDPLFQQSWLMKRTRTWPAGYPGDYVTLEGVYANTPQNGSGIGALFDRYLLSRTLAVAVRSRLRMLSRLLQERSLCENGTASWINLACGPCRELLSVPGQAQRTIWCVDRDPNALAYARSLLQQAGRNGDHVEWIQENVFKLGSTSQIVERFGRPSTIYSAGLFDYIPTDILVRCLARFYEALAPGGVLIAPFKDKMRYETFDYHWVAKWNFFLQRSEAEILDLLLLAGVPARQLTTQRDETGVILFVSAHR